MPRPLPTEPITGVFSHPNFASFLAESEDASISFELPDGQKRRIHDGFISNAFKPQGVTIHPKFAELTFCFQTLKGFHHLYPKTVSSTNDSKTSRLPDLKRREVRLFAGAVAVTLSKLSV